MGSSGTPGFLCQKALMRLGVNTTENQNPFAKLRARFLVHAERKGKRPLGLLQLKKDTTVFPPSAT